MSSGFVSAKVLEEKRRERQEEWEKVRKPDEPELAPEAPVDSRSLFEQLQSNKTKAQDEWDEAHKLKNQIRGIDDDEAEFLDEVDNARCNLERQRQREERAEIEQYRRDKEQLLLQAEEQERAKKAAAAVVRKKSSSSFSSSSQSKLLQAAVKRPAVVTVAMPTNKESVAKVAKVDSLESVAKAAKVDSLGALAGLGDYDSTSDDED